MKVIGTWATEIMEPKEVCKLLRVSRPTLAALPIPTVRIGKRDKYRYSDVTEFIEGNTNPSGYKRMAVEEKIKKRIRMKNKINQYHAEMERNGPTKV